MAADFDPILKIDIDGNLKLLDGNRTTVWSTNVSAESNNTIAVLSDKGDFLLKENDSGLLLWDNFNHPCDTLLPSMILGMNTQTGEKHFLSSWKFETHRHYTKRDFMSPEYAMGGIFSEKPNLFSFGILLLEIVSSKKNTSFGYHNEFLNLLAYAWNLWNENRGLHLMDQKLATSCSSSQVLRCVQVKLLCVQDHAVNRPTMPDIILMLSSETDLPQPKQPTFTFQRWLHPCFQPQIIHHHLLRKSTTNCRHTDSEHHHHIRPPPRRTRIVAEFFRKNFPSICFSSPPHHIGSVAPSILGFYFPVETKHPIPNLSWRMVRNPLSLSFPLRSGEGDFDFNSGYCLKDLDFNFNGGYCFRF